MVGKNAVLMMLWLRFTCLRLSFNPEKKRTELAEVSLFAGQSKKAASELEYLGFKS